MFWRRQDGRQFWAQPANFTKQLKNQFSLTVNKNKVGSISKFQWTFKFLKVDGLMISDLDGLIDWHKLATVSNNGGFKTANTDFSACVWPINLTIKWVSHINKPFVPIN